MIRFTQSKKDSRLKRAIKTRKKIKETAGHRISVFRSGRHIYAQLSTSGGDKVITIISTNQKTNMCKRNYITIQKKTLTNVLFWGDPQ